MNSLGRPSLWSQELADEICKRIALGASMRSIARDDDMPDLTTIYLWLRTKPDFSQQYAQATEDRADGMFEEMFDIADDGTNDYVERTNPNGTTYVALDAEHVQRSRLRVDTRKWALARMSPRKYGDKTTTEHTGGISVTISPIDAEL